MLADGALMGKAFDLRAPSGPKYVPSPTAEQFILATSEGPLAELRLLILEGPRGEGKTSAGIMACMNLGQRIADEQRARPGRRNRLPVKVAIVRDTWVNIERTTLESIRDQARNGMPIVEHEGGRELSVMTPDGVELVRISCFGLDRREDADKLQGFQCAILWLEEVAPAAGVSGVAGIPAEVLGLGVTSVRQSGIPHRILVTMNPPDDDHWIATVEKELLARGLQDFRVRRLVMPPGEKSAHFERLAEQTKGQEARDWGEAAREFDAYRMRNAAFLESIGRMDLVTRLVKGQRGMLVLGESVVPPFSRALHVAKGPLPIYPQLPIHRWWDSGTPNLHPAIVWAQVGPGWVNILGSRTGENVGIIEFIADMVLPFQARYGLLRDRPTLGKGFGRGAQAGYTFKDIGDPACLIPEGTSSQRTVALEIQNALQTSFEPGPQAWSARREALLAAFSRKGSGDRMFVMIDPEENELLVKALSGRFHYPKDQATGRIQGTIEAAKRVSGIFSHAVDCLGYGLGVLYPAAEWVRRPEPVPAPRRTARSWVGA